MNPSVMSFVTWAVMIAISVIAYKKTPAGAQLPLQWSFDGKVNSRGSKLIVVSIAPFLAIQTFAVLNLIFLAENELTNPSSFTIGLTGFISATLLLLHGGYMFFAVRDGNRHDGNS